MDFSKHLFRCSSLGHLMTEPKEKAKKTAGDLSEGAITHLIDIYVSQVYDRQTEISSKAIEKGLAVEEDSITLYSRFKGQFYKKNAERLTNGYIQGEPDLFEGKSIRTATHIIDIKSAWDIYTFFRTWTKSLSNIYYWQAMGYMALTGAKSATVAYCLVNTPELLILDEERRLLYKMNAGTTENPDYMEACEELRKSMIYDDIIISERVTEFHVKRDDKEIERLYSRIVKAREFLNGLYKHKQDFLTKKSRQLCPEQ